MKKKLRILTNNVHTTYACELARLEHDFLVENDAWDYNLRPTKPGNWYTLHTILKSDLKPDLILINHDWTLAQKYSEIYDCPMIFSVLADCSEGVFPKDLEDRCEAVTFLGREVAERWKFKNSLKKRILELGLDGAPYAGGDHSGGYVLTVGCSIGRRWDKGHCPLVTVSNFIPIKVVGPGNDGIPGAVGNVSYEELLRHYLTAQIYFNPGPVVGISMVEAMMSGLPVVTFRTINLCDLIQDGVNGFVVDTVDGAVMRLRELQEDPGLRMSMGAATQETARSRFSFERWALSWDYLFSSILMWKVDE